MTLYELWISLMQTLLGTVKFFKDHPTVPGVIILILRQDSIRKAINKQLPKQFRDTVDLDLLEIKGDIKLIKNHLGVIGEWQSNGHQNGLKRLPLSFNKLYIYLRKVIPLVNQLRRKNMLTNIVKANLSKKLISALVSILVVSLNQKFGLNLSENTVDLILGLSLAHISLQTIIDSIKANALSKIIKPTVTSSGSSNIKWDNLTFKEAAPFIQIVHEGINNLLTDVKRNDGSQAARDAMRAYNEIEVVLDAYRKTAPVAEVTELEESA